MMRRKRTYHYWTSQDDDNLRSVVDHLDARHGRGSADPLSSPEFWLRVQVAMEHRGVFATSNAIRSRYSRMEETPGSPSPPARRSGQESPISLKDLRRGQERIERLLRVLLRELGVEEHDGDV